MSLAGFDHVCSSCPWCRCRRWYRSLGARAEKLARWALVGGIAASVALVVALAISAEWHRSASKAKGSETSLAATAPRPPANGFVEFGPKTTPSAPPAAPAKAKPATKRSSLPTPPASVARTPVVHPPLVRANAGGAAAVRATPAPNSLVPARPSSSFALATAPPDPALARAAAECFSFVAKQPELIRGDFDSAGLRQMLEPTALEDRARARASQSRLKKLHGRLDDYEKHIRASAAGVVAKIETSAESPAVRSATLATVRSSGAQLVRDALNFVTLQRQILTQTEASVLFMRSRPDRFTVENRRLLFGDPSDRVQYDAMRTNLNELTSRQEQLLKGMSKAGEDAIAEVEGNGSAVREQVRVAVAP